MASLLAARYGPLLGLRFAGELNGDCFVAKAYWIASVDVTEPEGYQAYVAANAAAFAKYNGRFLARGPGDVLEGNPRPRNVVIEFDSHEQAVACFHSTEYQAAKAFRAGKADFNLSIVPGYEP